MIHTYFLNASKWISLCPLAVSFCIIFHDESICWTFQWLQNIGIWYHSSWGHYILNPIFPLTRLLSRWHKKMSLLKGFSTYFTETTFSIDAMLLGSQVILNWKTSQLINSCKSNICILTQWNLLRLHILYSRIYCKSSRFIINIYLTVLVWSM